MVVNYKKVLKLMREMSIRVKKRKKITRTTDSSHNLKVYPNLIKDLVVERIDQVWVCSDITYIALQSGFVYLAAIIDAFSMENSFFWICYRLRIIVRSDTEYCFSGH